MNREEVQKLLGGYATGTLTPEEQQILFEAALDDQELFDALAKEQPLRDLLRDPAAKAEVLAALDAREKRGGWMAWTRRPCVAGLAMAGLAAVGVAVWRGQGPGAKGQATEPQRDMVAQLKTQAPPVGEPSVQAEPPKAAALPVAPRRTETAKVMPHAAPGGIRQDKQEAAAPPAPTPPATAVASAGAQGSKETIEVTAAAPVVAENKSTGLRLANSQQVQQQLQADAQPSPMNQNQVSQTVNVQAQSQNTQDARAMFYEQQQPANSTTGFLPMGGGDAVGAKKKAAIAGAVGGLPVGHLGLKYSIVREGDREVDLSTPLRAGESVKLRIVPNVAGFLYVIEGNKTIANGQVKPNQKFETPALTSDAAGQRQFRIVLSRVAMSPGAAGVIGGVPRSDVVESNSEKDSATYAVLARMAMPQEQFVQQVTLIWR
jgi:hypothetical protein